MTTYTAHLLSFTGALPIWQAITIKASDRNEAIRKADRYSFRIPCAENGHAIVADVQPVAIVRHH